MANFPTSAPSATPATHGVVVDEIGALASFMPFRQPTYVSTFWYMAPHAYTQSSQTPSTGTLALSPFWLPFGTQIVQLGEWIGVVGGAGAVRRLGIYADNGSYYPGSLILDAGTYDATVANFRSVTAFSATDVGGLTWIGGVSQTATSTFIGISSSVPGISAGAASPGVGSNTQTAFQETGVTGALPATFTSTRTVTNGTSKTYFKIA